MPEGLALQGSPGEMLRQQHPLAPPLRTSADAGSIQPEGVGYSRGALGGC